MKQKLSLKEAENKLLQVRIVFLAATFALISGITSATWGRLIEIKGDWVTWFGFGLVAVSVIIILWAQFFRIPEMEKKLGIKK